MGWRTDNSSWPDRMSATMEARAIKNANEQECIRVIVSAGGLGTGETMKFLRPGVTENQVSPTHGLMTFQGRHSPAL